MKKHIPGSRVLLMLTAAALAGCGTNAAGAAPKPSPPAPRTLYRNTLPGQTASGTIDLTQSILAFPPGAASVVHKHTSAGLGTVLQGQLTIHTPSGDKQAAAGNALVEPVGQPVQAANSGSDEAMVAVAFPVPHGAKPTTPVAGQAAPAVVNQTLYTYTFAAPNISGDYSLVQQVLDFAPGSETPRHQHGGPGVATVTQGAITLTSDGNTTTYVAGQSFMELPGETLQASNQGTTDAKVVATFLLPDGKQLTTNV